MSKLQVLPSLFSSLWNRLSSGNLITPFLLLNSSHSAKLAMLTIPTWNMSRVDVTFLGIIKNTKLPSNLVSTPPLSCASQIPNSQLAELIAYSLLRSYFTHKLHVGLWLLLQQSLRRIVGVASVCPIFFRTEAQINHCRIFTADGRVQVSCLLYRARNKSLQNIAKQDLGRARQKS